MRLLTVVLLSAGLSTQLSGAKAIFYDPGDNGAPPAAQHGAKLRPINGTSRFLHGGIHYWLEDASGKMFTEDAASRLPGKFTLHIRNNVARWWLTVQREFLTPG
jgi:hypothetical protein